MLKIGGGCMCEEISPSIENELQDIHNEIKRLKNADINDLVSCFKKIRDLNKLGLKAKQFLKTNEKILLNYPEKINTLSQDAKSFNLEYKEEQNDIRKAIMHQYSVIFECIKNKKNTNNIIDAVAIMNTSIQSFYEFFNDDNKKLATTIIKKLDSINEFCKTHNIDKHDIDNMSGQNFENYCANLLIAYGFKNIEVTKGSGDQGVDIIGYYNGYKYAIQCKRYSKKLGNSPVQEVVAGKNFYNCQNAMVITNNYFTDAAIQLAKANNVELWDRNNLMQVIYYTDSQWDELLDKIKI